MTKLFVIFLPIDLKAVPVIENMTRFFFFFLGKGGWGEGDALKTKEFWDKVYYITHHSDLKDNLTSATIQNQRFD